jgi:hypothetical protein
MALSALQEHGQGVTFPGIVCSKTGQYIFDWFKRNWEMSTAGIYLEISFRLHSVETTRRKRRSDLFRRRKERREAEQAYVKYRTANPNITSIAIAACGES